MLTTTLVGMILVVPTILAASPLVIGARISGDSLYIDNCGSEFPNTTRYTETRNGVVVFDASPYGFACASAPFIESLSSYYSPVAGSPFVSVWTFYDGIGSSVESAHFTIYGNGSGFRLIAAVADGFDYPIGSRPYYTQAPDGDGWKIDQDHGDYYRTNQKYHLGEDWNLETGMDTDCEQPVFSAAHGTIVFAGVGGGTFGNVLIIRHQLPDGSEVDTLYGHLQSFTKTSGGVNRREQIGTVGKGGSTYCHLHFEVRFSNCPYFDPPAPGSGYSTAPRPSGWTDPSDFIDSHRFYPGAIVQVFNVNPSTLKIRAPSACSNVIGERSDGAIGTVVGGPIGCESETGFYHRYQVFWSDGVEGWSAQNWLRAVPVHSRRIVATGSGVGLKGVNISWGTFQTVSVEGGDFSIPLSLCGFGTLIATKAGYATLTKALNIPCPLTLAELAAQQFATPPSHDEITSALSCAGIPVSTLFAIGDSVEVYGTEIGLRGRTPNACSDTWRTFADGATGTIVGGPECCNGYNRWQIRYAGETTNRWSAEREPNTQEYFLRRVGTLTVPVTISTVPAGLQINVDGRAYGAPLTFNWSAGSTHSIGTISPQSGSPGIEYVWSSWGDGGAISHLVAPTAAITYTATFTTNIVGPILTVGTSAMDVGYDFGTGAFWVLNDGVGTLDWSGTTTDSWLTIDTPGGTINEQGGRNPFRFSFAQNPSTTARIGTITISAPGASGSLQSVTVTQAGQPAYFEITIIAQNGTVSKSPDQTNYLANTEVILTAIPGDGYQFTHWSGDVGSSENPLTVLMNTHKSIAANFASNEAPNRPLEGKFAVALDTFNAKTSTSEQDGGTTVFGDFDGSIMAGGQSLTSVGNRDIYGVRFNASHQAIWVQQYGASPEELVNSCASHPAGGWAISGNFRSSTVLGSTSLVSVGSRDAFLARLDQNGDVLWARRVGGTSVDYGLEVAVDSNGNCFLAGVFTGSATVSGTTTTLSATGSDFDGFVVKYTSNGDFEWVRTAGGPAYDYVNCISVDSQGNLYVGGLFAQQITIGSFVLTNPGVPSGTDSFVTKLTPAGTVSWAKRVGQSGQGSSVDYLTFLVPVNDGCFFGGGYDLGMLLDGQSLPDQTSQTAFAGKISENGSVQWLRAIRAVAMPQSGIPSAYSQARDGAASTNNGLIVSGLFRGVVSFGSSVMTNAAEIDNLYIASFDPFGVANWALSPSVNGYNSMTHFSPIGGDRFRFASPFNYAAGFPGITPLVANGGDAVLIEIGPEGPVPRIGLTIAADYLIFTWPREANGYTLEYATNLSATIWTPVSPGIPVGDSYSVTNLLGGGRRFYRLRK